jgi:Ca2+-binding RTX toxin-like protein
MRRVTLMLAAVAMIVALFAVAAYAADIQGTNDSEDLLESDRSDTITALEGDDFINATTYASTATREENDRAHGNNGDDIIWVNDGDGDDHAFGGEGDDTCLVDPGDEFDGCETLGP